MHPACAVTGLLFHSQFCESGLMSGAMSGRDGGPAARPARRIGVRELAPLLGTWRQERAPGYQALADRLRMLVLDGRLPVHAVLPSERALAEATGTSRTTTTAAYRLLRESGFAVADQGSGTWTALPRGAAA